MENFTIVDGIVALLIILSALLAYSRGVVREILAIVVWIVSGTLALQYAVPVGGIVGNLPVVETVVKGSCQLQVLLGFAAAFAGFLGVLSLIAPLISSLIRRTALDSVDQALGFFFGVVRGVLLITAALFMYKTVMTKGHPAVDNSQTAVIFASLVNELSDEDTQNALSWTSGRYSTLLANCSDE